MFELRKDEARGEEMRAVFRKGIEALMDRDDKVVAMDADLGSASSFLKIKDKHPDRFFDIGIAEANMVGIAAGLSIKGYKPFLHTFGPFFARRALDQIFLEGAYAGNTMHLYASDPGVCAATNGGTHSTYEDIAIMRAIPGIEVYDPADAVQLAWLIPEIADRKGVHFIRTTRKDMPAVYTEGSTFEIGKGNVLTEGGDVLIVTMGMGVKISLDAESQLRKQGIAAEVIDMFTLAPLDEALLREHIPGKKAVVTVENHSVTGGLGSAVADVIAEEGLGVRLKKIGNENRFGQVGSVDYQMEDYGMTAAHIIETVKEML